MSMIILLIISTLAFGQTSFSKKTNQQQANYLKRMKGKKFVWGRNSILLKDNKWELHIVSTDLSEGTGRKGNYLYIVNKEAGEESPIPNLFEASNLPQIIDFLSKQLEISKDEAGKLNLYATRSGNITRVSFQKFLEKVALRKKYFERRMGEKKSPNCSQGFQGVVPNVPSMVGVISDGIEVYPDSFSDTKAGMKDGKSDHTAIGYHEVLSWNILNKTSWRTPAGKDPFCPAVFRDSLGAAGNCPNESPFEYKKRITKMLQMAMSTGKNVILLQELTMKPGELKKIIRPNYVLRGDTRGGTVTLVKSDIVSKKLTGQQFIEKIFTDEDERTTFLASLNFQDDRNRGKGITYWLNNRIKAVESNGKLYVSVHGLSRSANFRTFLTRIFDKIQTAATPEVIFGGDFNHPLDMRLQRDHRLGGTKLITSEGAISGGKDGPGGGYSIHGNRYEATYTSPPIDGFIVFPNPDPMPEPAL